MHIHDIDEIMVTPVPCAAQTVRAAARLLTRRYEEALRPTGLSASQYTVLTAVIGAGGLSQGLLGEALAFEQTTVTRLVGVMLRRGILELKADPKDGRRKIVHATAEGVALYEQGKPLWHQAQADTIGSLTDDEWKATRSALRKLTE
ncbi:MAG: MarR family winged helix-turn-helix transcriptional regulator [Roseobacter sp.]